MERADVDQSLCFGLVSSSSLIHSTPSQNLSDLVSQILESSNSTLDPPIQSNNLTPASLIHEPSVQDISSSFTSPSCVEAVTSTLDSFTLSDDVFFGTRCYNRKNTMASSASEQTGSSCTVDSFSENTESSDGIRGVYYYLTSSRDSSEHHHAEVVHCVFILFDRILFLRLCDWAEFRFIQKRWRCWNVSQTS